MGLTRNRIPFITAELPVRIDEAVRLWAEMVANGARDRVVVDTGTLRDAIHVERADVLDYSVVAGSNKAFYGHIVEHGSVRTPARPFLVPAAEAARPAIQALAREALSRL